MNDINSQKSTDLRRMRDNLTHAGYGYIIFGIWSIIKLFMMATMQDEFLTGLYELHGLNEDDRPVVIGIYIALYVIVAVFTIWMHVWIGRGAVRYAGGRDTKKRYLKWAVVGVIVTIAFFPFYFSDVYTYGAAAVNERLVTSILVDITMIFIFLDMIVSTVKIDRLMQDYSNGEERER